MLAEYAAELYVHAIAIEREGAQRYAEFARSMSGQGNAALAGLFRMLSALEAKRLDELKRTTATIELPPLGADYSWRSDGAPPTAGTALTVALEAEKRARAFFEHAGRIADDPAARMLAKEMAAEEAEHIALIERMLERAPG